MLVHYCKLGEYGNFLAASKELKTDILYWDWGLYCKLQAKFSLLRFMALAWSVQAINQSQIKQGSVAYSMDWKIKVSNYRYLEKDIFLSCLECGTKKKF